MSKLQITATVQIAAGADEAFGSRFLQHRMTGFAGDGYPGAADTQFMMGGAHGQVIRRSTQQSGTLSPLPTRKIGEVSRIGLKMTLAAISLCGLAVSASAQDSVAREQGFTIAPNVQTPIVLQTQPDAACNLHPAGVNDPAQTMRLYANAEGYVRVHVTAKQETQEVRVQLDCGAAVYPLHLRAGSSPTADMPSPQTVVPVPQGAQVLPALTEQEAKLLSDNDLIARGYPVRPDAAASPNRYVKWFDLVSRPITQIPPHVVSRSDVTHMPRVEAGTNTTSGNWSGLEARGPKRSYMAVGGEWNVPPIALGEPGLQTYSALWVGLDGDGNAAPFGTPAGHDLVQAGTEQDFTAIGSYGFANYYAWTEIVPNEAEQPVGLSISPGDLIQVEVWIGDGTTDPPDQNGTYGNFRIINWTQGQSSLTRTPLDGTHFVGSEAEWIMERPCLSLCKTSTPQLADLSAYLITSMSDAVVLPTTGSWINSGKAANLQITMYNGKDELSWPLSAPPSAMLFQWVNFH
jgi:hypothetical protein